MRLEKKDWISPRTNYQEFVPQDFIAACYHVDCKTDARNGWYLYVYLDSNNNGELDRNDQLVHYTATRFRGCGVKHTGVISDVDLQYNGFVSILPAGTTTWAQQITRVYVWNQHTLEYGDVHVCYNPTDAERQDESRPNAS